MGIPVAQVTTLASGIDLPAGFGESRRILGIDGGQGFHCGSAQSPNRFAEAAKSSVKAHNWRVR